MILAIFLLGCGTTETPVDAPKADEAPVEVPAPVVEPAPESELPLTTIVGHGITFQIRAPYQVMHARFRDVPDQIIATWWDVTVEGAGGHVARGIYTIVIKPHASTDPDAEIAQVSEGEKKEGYLTYRLGTDGTEVLLKEPLESFEDIGSLTPGPTTPSWKILQDGAEVDWPEGMLLQSADPANGQPYEFLRVPTRPWGPWPAETPGD